MNSGCIITYKNPDTDGVCSSIAYSYYLNLVGKEFKPVFWGQISSETKFVLDKANVSYDFASSYKETDKVILIDTHHLSQLENSLNPLNVIEVLDHHPAGDAHAFPNAKIDNRMIGAVASIVAEKILDMDAMTSQMAILLGSAIISNTMNFTAPSSTQYDFDMFNKLCQYYDFTDDYIALMFASKNAILKLSFKEVLESDVKIFEVNGNSIALAQIELVNVDKSLNVKQVIPIIGQIKQESNQDYYIVSIIDVIRKVTYVLSCDKKSQHLVSEIFDRNAVDEITVFDRILLRKTDFIPRIKKIFNN